MSAGTIALTNNSATVLGTGTAFTTDLKANDFIVVIVGGVTYTLGVKAIASATSLTLITPYGGPTATGNAWTAVPNATLVGITAQVAADVAKAIRGLNLDKANWQQVFSGTGTITVTLPDGSTYNGPAWSNITTSLAAKAAKGVNGDITSLTGLTTALSIGQGGTGATTAAAARTALGAAPLASPAFAGNGSIAGNFTVGAQVSAGPAGFYTQGLNNPAVQGSYIGWNGTGLVGGADFLCNRGTGDGGFRFRTVNNTNTAVITDFTMLNTGQGVSSAGWVAVSDIDVKMNVVEIEPEKALSALTSWRTCSWDYCDVPSEYDEAGKVISVTKGAKGFGFIAQDVQKDCPDAVTLTKNPQLYIDEEGEFFAKEDTLSLNTLGVSAAYSGAAIKALKKRNEDQAELITALSERLKAIEAMLDNNGVHAS
ncbi:tail fiber domain-containing protein [Rahnella aceris]|uniref:tail fiber domain-containing protein n=1 Tax=Rahnella sp. (strain Y9602) TaxID=2703885 RepID=UPI003BA232DA